MSAKPADQENRQMTAIVLAGGKSSRMGRDKSTVLFSGEPLLLRALRVLKERFGEVIVVTNQEVKFELPDVKIIHDDVPYQGPLGGISAGLKASSYDINFVVAVDMPFISVPVINYLAGLAQEADAVVPRTGGGLEPLFAFYNKSCLSLIDKALAEGERKVVSPLLKVDLRVVDCAEIGHLEGVARAFVNINTEHDLKEAIMQEDCFQPEAVGDDILMPAERAITVYVNSEELVTMQSSLEHVDELACGFLVSEGVLQVRDELEDIRVNECRGEVRVRTNKMRSNAAKSMGKRFVTSGCGKGFTFVSLGDAVGIASVASDFKVPAQAVPILMKEFLRVSGRPGMHASAIVKGDKITLVRHDIGRHNTVDMILGRLWLDEDDDRDIMLFTTGRVSYEMVVKAAKARIPVVVSRTAATDLAVRLADRLGIEVIGYVRGRHMKVYTDGGRLEGSWTERQARGQEPGGSQDA